MFTIVIQQKEEKYLMLIILRVHAFTRSTSSKVNQTVGRNGPGEERARVAIGIRHCAPRREESMSPYPVGHDGIEEDTEDG